MTNVNINGAVTSVYHHFSTSPAQADIGSDGSFVTHKGATHVPEARPPSPVGDAPDHHTQLAGFECRFLGSYGQPAGRFPCRVLSYQPLLPAIDLRPDGPAPPKLFEKGLLIYADVTHDPYVSILFRSGREKS
jgi:hypothetical protein